MRRLTRGAIGLTAGVAFGAAGYAGTGAMWEGMRYERAEVLEFIDDCAAQLGETAMTATELPEPCEEYFEDDFARTTTKITEYDPETREYTSETETEYALPAADTFERDQTANTPMEAEQTRRKTRFSQMGAVMFGLVGLWSGYDLSRTRKKDEEDEAAAYAAPSTIKNAP